MMYPTLEPEVYRPSQVLPGYNVKIRSDLKKSVFFLGNGTGDNFRARGTAFWVVHDEFLHIVTAKHNAVNLADDPFTARFNLKSGEATEAEFDFHNQDFPWRWFVHEDQSVDVAVMIAPLRLEESGVDYFPLSSQLFLPDDLATEEIGHADDTYTVGLFQRMQGKKANFPVVHSGRIAAIPSNELVPVKDWDRNEGIKEIKAYLVEQISLGGLSGAPVFVRSSLAINGMPTQGGDEDVLLQRDRFYLLGLWHGAWDAPPDEIMREEVGAGVRVPVGMGIVVPVKKILEVLNMSEITQKRDEFRKAEKDDLLPQADFAGATDSKKGDALLGKMLNTPPKKDD